MHTAVIVVADVATLACASETFQRVRQDRPKRQGRPGHQAKEEAAQDVIDVAEYQQGKGEQG